MRSPASKYRPFPVMPLKDRTWPDQVISRAPAWCSVDLRDGNQALVEPLNSERKRRLFDLLVQIGFREIEIGFPAASQTDYAFCRELIEQQLIPDDLTVQVLVQARKELVEQTFAALRGVRRAIIHVYNSTSELQRRVVFGADREAIKALAVKGALLLHDEAARYPETEWIFQYSPESFTGTELDYALEVCEAVMDVWQPTAQRPCIINLPATVEMAPPNIYADQIEWMHRHFSRREAVILSLHPHNDRGTAVAAAEQGLMAGADRVEGTLFGNGERTGNVDLITLALNLYTQGVEPGLDFSDINAVVRTAESCTQLPVHPRHPYAGELVFTAFSGSHQDAIKKGFLAQKNHQYWEVPYLPIDPADVGRTYEGVIRINSQSGKGGVAYILEQEYALDLPRTLQVEFREIIQELADRSGKELLPDDLWQAFEAHYLQPDGCATLVSYRDEPIASAQRQQRQVSAALIHHNQETMVHGQGSGPLEAFVNAMGTHLGLSLQIGDYRQHAIGPGADAKAAAYVQLTANNSVTRYGVGIDSDVVAAAFRAVLSALARATPLLQQDAGPLQRSAATPGA